MTAPALAARGVTTPALALALATVDTFRNQIVHCDALTLLRSLPDESVNCIVTSPPYYGLRKYTDGDAREVGLEETPEQYVARLVEIMREARRVLRADGTCWLNLGDSYSTGSMSNVTDCFNSVMKGARVVFLDTVAVTTPAQGVDVAPDNEGAPNGVFPCLLGPERIGIEERQDNFSEIVDFFAPPRDRSVGRTFPGMVGDGSAAYVGVQEMYGIRIIKSDLDANAEPELTILRTPCAGASESDNASLSVEETREPGAKVGVRWHPTWDTFSLAARSKGVPDIDLVNQPVALRNGHLPFACLLRDFRVTQASEQEIALSSVGSGLVFTVSDVRHLRFSFADGSVIPYRTLYDKSIRLASSNRAKQEIGIPEMVKRALMEDGWICRSTIIWAKPSTMPESVRDRPTKAHEYIFMLTKSARYWYDADAIAEPSSDNSHGGGQAHEGRYMRLSGRNDGNQTMGIVTATRNKRTVWTVATQPSPIPHFAMYPPALIEPCVLAGCPEDVCAECGAPYERVVEREANKVNLTEGMRQARRSDGAQTGGTKCVTLGVTEYVTRHTLGFRPTCDCHAATRPGIVLDPFMGVGTTALVAIKHGRDFVGCDLNATSVEWARRRVAYGGDDRRMMSDHAAGVRQMTLLEATV